jgi:hypothetical protein
MDCESLDILPVSGKCAFSCKVQVYAIIRGHLLLVFVYSAIGRQADLREQPRVGRKSVNQSL